VRAGDFVAADVGPATPMGLLGRVVGSRHAGGSTLVTIRPASLTDAVPVGSISLRPAPAAGVRSPATAFRARARRFRSALGCGPGVAGELDGSLAVRLIPTFKLDWSLLGVDRVEAKATIQGSADLRASIGGAGVCELEETSVARWDAPPLRFFAGPIPVVVVPRTNLFVEAEASTTAGVQVRLRGRFTATAGLTYDGAAHPIGSFSHDFSHTAPKRRVTGRLSARLIPAITFLLYGRAGPRFDLSTGLDFDAQADGEPAWILSAPVELRAGIDVPGFNLAIPQQTVFSRSFPIAQAPSGGGFPPDGPAPPEDDDPASAPPPPPDHAPPPDGTGTQRARISWNTGATDVDLHVWDGAGDHAWFRDPTGIPGAELTEDDRYGFGPEHFREHAPTGRSLTYGLCYFDDSGGGATTVSIELTDPGGGPRQLTRTLAREGGHLLVGSSPAGSEFVPPDGWCRP
jgi:hypothetical protein